MNKTLIVLILLVLVLAWNFVFSDKQVTLTDQAKVLQGLSSAVAYKTAVVEFWSAQGKLPDRTEWIRNAPPIKVDLSRTIVSAIEVGTDGPGVISVHYIARPGLESPAAIEGKTINLIPVVTNGKLAWMCKGSFDVTLLPKNCSPL